MNRFLRYMLAASFVLFSSLRADSEVTQGGRNTTVELPAFSVTADWFDVNYRVSKKTDRIVSVMVTEITPGGPASGVDFRKGDLLVAIDEKPVVGMLRAEFLSVFVRTIDDGHPKVFSFVRKLGLFGSRTKNFDMTFTAKKLKKGA